MKRQHIFISLLAVLVLVGFLSIKNIYDRIFFDVKLKKINTATIKLSDLLLNNGFFRLEFLIKISNFNKIEIPVKDLYIKVFYKNKAIGQSSAIDSRNTRIMPQGSTEVVKKIDVYVKPELLNLLTDLITSTEPELEAEVSFRLYGLRIKKRIKITQE